jgi:hypothetical protein
MVGTALVEEYKNAGREFLARLDEAGVDVRAALWFYVEPSEIWRLILAIPEVDRSGTAPVYARILPVLHEHGQLTINDVTVTGLKDPLIQELAARVQNRTGLAKIFVRKEYLKSTYVEDAYIYRMNV